MMENRNGKIKSNWKLWAVVFVLAAVIVAATVRIDGRPVLNITGRGTKALIVVDAGHGGFDPGKVGTAGTLEKDINLMIAQKLQNILEDSGYQVIMTRESDTALCDSGATRKKMEDLKNRVAIINDNKPALAVSIHQNSFSAGTKGAQVFYYQDSEPSREFASVLQNTVKEELADGNKRVEKGDGSYYMLKKTEGVFAIIECGFLSNPTEEVMLNSDDYQQKMAEAIAEGIENYLYG